MRKDLNEIKSVLEDKGYPIQLTISELFEKFKIKTICKNAGASKEQGYSVVEIFFLIVLMPLLLQKTVDAWIKSHFSKETDMKKDTIYRFKNNCNMPWRVILFGVAKRFKILVSSNESIETSSKNEITAFIVDDTMNAKRGKFIENISFVHDHTSGKNKSQLGFKNLVLGYYDGKSILPVDFTIQKEKNLSLKTRKNQFSKEISKDSRGFKRRKEATIDKITNSISMIKRAVKNGFRPSYVLSDAWFPSKKYITEIRNIKDGAMHVISGIRKDNRKYDFDGEQLNANEIIKLLKSKGPAKRNRKWNTRYYEVTVNYEGVEKVKLYFCRFPHQKTWRLFISTDITLSFVKMMEIYTIRWTIEVMFKEMKQYLNLEKCQSRDFDAHITQITISCVLFIFLSYLKRIRDYETIGGILSLLNAEIVERTLVERIWNLFEELLETIINIISVNGNLDISEFKNSAEFIFLKELFEDSFLGRQLKIAN